MFEKGDRVFNRMRGIGTVVFTDEDSHQPYLVEYDNNIDGHDGSIPGEYEALGKYGHCWWEFEDEIKVFEISNPQPIQLPVDSLEPSALTITLQKGVENLEGEFEVDGEVYRVSVEKV